MKRTNEFIEKINNILARENHVLSLYETEKLHLLRIKRKSGNRSYTLRNATEGQYVGPMYTNMMAVERIMQEIEEDDARDMVIAAYFYGG